MDKTLITVAGGEDVEIVLADGTKETVKVRQLPIRELPKYMAVVESEPDAVELICQKPKGWADTVTPESFEALIETCERINLDPLARLAARTISRQKRLLPKEYADLQQKAIANVIEHSTQSLPSTPHKPA